MEILRQPHVRCHFAVPFTYSHTQVGLFGVVGLAAIAATGTGLIMTPLLNLVLGLVDERQAGMASGVISMLQQIGAALGVAAVDILFGVALGSGSVGQSGSYASAFVAGMSYNVGAILARASRK